jgi:hypothetical protein
MTSSCTAMRLWMPVPSAVSSTARGVSCRPVRAAHAQRLA